MFSRWFYSTNYILIILFTTLLFFSMIKMSFAENNMAKLTLDKAAKIAVERDFLIRSYLAKSQAFQEESVALNTLPDPKLKLGFLNLPDDTYNQNQENMTQKKIGIFQAFPKGDSLEIKSQRAIIGSDRNLIRVEERKRKVVESTQKAWLEVFYWVRAKAILDENRFLFSDLVKITEGQYAAGKRRQFDYVQAQIELDLLNDQDYMFSEKEQVARAELARWVGIDNSQMFLSGKLTELHTDIISLDDLKKSVDKIYEIILEHPVIQLMQNNIRFNQKTVELARQDYRPAWSLDFSYGIREDNPSGIERANSVSALVMIDIPLFTNNRQDRRVASKLKRVSASKNDLDNMVQVLNSKLEKTLTRLTWLRKRMNHYKTILFSRAEQNSAAALIAYQSDRSDFVSLIKAHIIEFNTQLQFTRLYIDHVSTEATLSYLLGDK